MSVWWVYILESQTSGKLYTGISTDVERRLAKHNAGKGAKFTRAGRPWVVVYRSRVASQSAALKYEAWIKKLPRRCKVMLIDTGGVTGKV